MKILLSEQTLTPTFPLSWPTVPSAPLKQHFVLIKEELAKVHSGKTEEITGIPAAKIRLIAKRIR